MPDGKRILCFIVECLGFARCFMRTLLSSDKSKDYEILLLRSQLSLLQQEVGNKKRPKPHPTPAFRLLAVFLSHRFPGWKSALVIVKPETVIRWHRHGFRLYWTLKSRKKKPGRPQVSRQTIALIKRIHKENPLLSPEKIHELLVNLAVSDAPAPNTIAKYLPDARKPPSEKQLQSWKTFLKNQNLWSMDLFTVPTIRFQLLYVLVIVSHARRRIECFAVTTNPTAAWVAQQIRNATAFGKQPKYLLHDNDSIFTADYLQRFLSNAGIESAKTSVRCPWQNGGCERLVGIIRKDVLNHVIPLNKDHLERTLREYVNGYYNPHRTHQGIGCETPDISPRPVETKAAGTKLASQELLGGLYHTYSKSA